jgi:hypothetical protein
MPCGIRPSNVRVCHFTTRAGREARIEDGRWKMAARKSAFASSARFAVLPGDHDDPNDEQEKLERGEQSRHDLRTAISAS